MATSKPIALLIRHGEDTLSNSGVFVSWTDVPLTAKGRAEAEEAAGVLDEYDIEYIYSSPLQRSLETAKIYTSGHIMQEGALLPWNRGILTGCLEDEGEDLLDLLVQNPDIHIPHGESRKECEDRLRDFFMPALDIAEQHPTAFFTHHSVIDVLNSLLKGQRSKKLVNLVKQGGIVAVHIDGDGYRLEAIYKPDDDSAKGMS